MKKLIGTIIVIILTPFIAIGFIFHFITRAFNTGTQIADSFVKILQSK